MSDPHLAEDDPGDDLLRVVELLVDDPEAIVLEEFEEGRNTLCFDLSLAQDDVGKVIGRQGRTVRALRTLLELRGSEDRQRYELEILD